jgi:predicted aconitase
MILTTEESRMLDGGLGPLVRQAMAKTVEYGRVCGAERLCDVTMAHLFCGAYHWMDAAGPGDFDSIHSTMAFDSPERLLFDRVCPGCRCQADVSPVPLHNWEAAGVDPSFFALNQGYLERFAAMGVSLAITCVPYLAGFAPLPGEHFVSSESHAVFLMNSLWGARGQADGVEAGFWAAVCGKTPYWGLHDPANRKGNLIIRVDCDLATVHDWDLLGHAAGLRIPPLTVPIFVGFPRPDIHKLKSCAASMATTSGTELAHFVGLTPEAPDLEAALAPGTSKEEIVVRRGDLEDSRA